MDWVIRPRIPDEAARREDGIRSLQRKVPVDLVLQDEFGLRADIARPAAFASAKELHIPQPVDPVMRALTPVEGKVPGELKVVGELQLSIRINANQVSWSDRREFATVFALRK